MAQVIDMKLELRSNLRNYFDVFKQISEAELCFYEDYPVVTATTDGAIALGSITTADIFYISSDQAITYKLNGSATAVTLDANCHHIYMGTAITALTVTNASGSTAYLDILFAGA